MTGFYFMPSEVDPWIEDVGDRNERNDSSTTVLLYITAEWSTVCTGIRMSSSPVPANNKNYRILLRSPSAE